MTDLIDDSLEKAHQAMTDATKITDNEDRDGRPGSADEHDRLQVLISLAHYHTDLAQIQAARNQNSLLEDIRDTMRGTLELALSVRKAGAFDRTETTNHFPGGWQR